MVNEENIKFLLGNSFFSPEVSKTNRWIQFVKAYKNSCSFYSQSRVLRKSFIIFSCISTTGDQRPGGESNRIKSRARQKFLAKHFCTSTRGQILTKKIWQRCLRTEPAPISSGPKIARTGAEKYAKKMPLSAAKSRERSKCSKDEMS